MIKSALKKIEQKSPKSYLKSPLRNSFDILFIFVLLRYSLNVKKQITCISFLISVYDITQIIFFTIITQIVHNTRHYTFCFLLFLLKYITLISLNVK